MDLTAYLLDSVIAATTPPGETEFDARTRAGAIAGMLRAYAPGDGMEAMMACQCIMMQFVTTAAMRDASNLYQSQTVRSKAPAGAIAASRTLHQWVTKFENTRKRNELRAAQAAKDQAAEAEAAKAQVVEAATLERPAMPKSPEPQPVASPSAPEPVRNGRIADTTCQEDQLLAAAVAMRISLAALSVSDLEAPPKPPLSLQAERSIPA